MKFTIRVEHRVGRDWLVAYVAYCVACGAKPPMKTRAFWIGVKGDLKENGEEMFWNWSDHANPDEQGKIQADAETFVDTLFPGIE